LKLLVTGGAGFIGSEFVREGVKRGYEIVVVDKLTYAGDLDRLKEVKENTSLPGFITFYKADITNKEFIEHIFKTEKPKVVIHFAAESHVDRSILDASPFIKTNVEGTQVLLDVAKDIGVDKFINIATDEVYGELGQEGTFKEDSPLVPNSPYSSSKAAADMLGRAYYKTYKLPVITVRPSNNYGPWQYPEKLIPVVILKALNNEKIPVYGTGQNVREWLYVSDCAEAIFEIMEKGKIGEIYNVGSNQELRNIDVVKTILKILNKKEDLIEFVKDRPGHDFRYSLDTTKIKNELGWEAKTTFEEGIEKTVKWYIENMAWVEKKLKYLKEYWDKVYSV
jgi:dTDP-glucose 4,6-dehydratase